VAHDGTLLITPTGISAMNIDGTTFDSALEITRNDNYITGEARNISLPGLVTR
jgi:hypothetical protein